MTYIPRIVMAAMALFTIPSLPWLLLDFPPAVNFVGERAPSWHRWLFGHVAIVLGFGGAAYLSYRRSRYWPYFMLAICSYVASIATRPLIYEISKGDVLGLVHLIVAEAVSRDILGAFYLIWNLLILPTVPALLIPFAVWASWKSMKGYTWA